MGGAPHYSPPSLVGGGERERGKVIGRCNFPPRKHPSAARGEWEELPFFPPPCWRGGNWERGESLEAVASPKRGPSPPQTPLAKER